MTTATGLVIGGERVLVPGLTIQNWDDDPTFRARMPGTGKPADATRRRGFPRGIVMHSTHGVPGGADQRPQRVRAGMGPAGGAAEANVHYWAGNNGQAATHLIIDFDAQVICTADLLTECCFHVGGPNDTTNHHTIGIEIVQGLSGSEKNRPPNPDDYAYFYAEQIVAAIKLVDAIRQHPKLAIQAQIQSPYHGSANPVKRVQTEVDWTGVILHRDQTSGRGRGDAGDCVLEAFLAAGYEPVDLATGEDLTLWKSRQASLVRAGATLRVDGQPGPLTAAAIEKYMRRPHGMWVPR
jgi:hypothetical protein